MSGSECGASLWSRYPAAVSVGRRATFQEGNNGDVLLEAHLLDFSEDIYGVSMTVSLYGMIRAQRSYRRVQHLVDQLGRHADAVRRWAREPERRRSDAIPSWAVLRAQSAVTTQLALGRGVPDSKVFVSPNSELTSHLLHDMCGWIQIKHFWIEQQTPESHLVNWFSASALQMIEA